MDRQVRGQGEELEGYQSMKLLLQVLIGSLRRRVAVLESVERERDRSVTEHAHSPSQD